MKKVLYLFLMLFFVCTSCTTVNCISQSNNTSTVSANSNMTSSYRSQQRQIYTNDDIYRRRYYRRGYRPSGYHEYRG